MRTPVAAGFASVTWNIVDALQLATRTMSPVASVLAGELAATCGAATVLGHRRDDAQARHVGRHAHAR